MKRCPRCGYPLAQMDAPPYACTHPNKPHYSTPGAYGCLVVCDLPAPAPTPVETPQAPPGAPEEDPKPPKDTREKKGPSSAS